MNKVFACRICRDFSIFNPLQPVLAKIKHVVTRYSVDGFVTNHANEVSDRLQLWIAPPPNLILAFANNFVPEQTEHKLRVFCACVSAYAFKTRKTVRKVAQSDP